MDELGHKRQRDVSVSSNLANSETPRARYRPPIDAIAISRKARKTTCPTCRREVLQGLDHDYCGFLATVDPTPLPDRAAELEALLEGSRTYGLWRVRDGHELEHRSQFSITAPWVESGRLAILADHRCDRYWPQPAPTIEPPKMIDREECPF